MRNIKDLIDEYKIHATDGIIGEVEDFYFEDLSWTVRYLIVDIGTWLSDRKVLISPVALEKPDWDKKILHVSLTKDQIERSPEVKTSKPISREYEAELHRYYEWPLYWDYGPIKEEANKLEKQKTTNLRSVKEIIGYRVKATEGEIGPLLDLVFDYENWIIRYMIISTRYIIEHARDLIKGKKVLISPDWTEISWAESEIYVDHPIDIIKDGPEYDPDVTFDREFEEIIYDYYKRPKYWE
ncbi:PRC-barrel domain containing protein [Candidatus Poribacteria bacterium]|nr:PRC-barrel domain containing protein [Candidatus Poribacteria bacterium]